MTVVNEENLIGLMTLEKHGLINIASSSSSTSSKSKKSKSSSSSSSAAVTPPLMVTYGCGEVLGNIENGLLLLPGEEKTTTKEIMNIITDNSNDNDNDVTTTSYWESSSNNPNPNRPKIKFDNDGYVIFLDIGGKRLHKGFPSFSTSTSDDDDATVDDEVFSKFSRLKTLNMAGTDLPIQDIMKILNSLSKSKSSSLECLYCGGNGLGGSNDGMKIFAEEWLSSCRNNLLIKKLDLRYNDIGNEGMKSICDSLLLANNNNNNNNNTNTNKIEYLYLEGNNIGDDGVIALSELIKQSSSCCSQLREIYLGANQIQSKGAEHLAESLKSPNCHLIKLYLEGNNIGLDGANAFSNVLEELELADDGSNNNNTTLKYLYVDNNNIGKDGMNRLAKALKSNTTIIG